MAYDIIIDEPGGAELANLRVYEQRIIVEAIRTHLRDQPLRVSRRLKPLENVKPTFEHAWPLWELRVRNHRVFYDVDISLHVVHIRAVRHKPPAATTEDIL